MKINKNLSLYNTAAYLIEAAKAIRNIPGEELSLKLIEMANILLEDIDVKEAKISTKELEDIYSEIEAI